MTVLSFNDIKVHALKNASGYFSDHERIVDNKYAFHEGPFKKI